MPRKKTVKSTRTRVARNEVQEMSPASSPTRTLPTVGPSNLLTLLLILVSFFAGYLFFKVKNLEQQAKAGAGTQQQGTAGGAAANVALSVDSLKKYAKDLGLDTNKFNACLDKGEKTQAVTADANEAGSLGVQGTPGFFINGRFLGGAFPFEMFKEIIDKEIAGTATANCADYSADLQKYCDEKGTDASKPFNPTPKQVSMGSSTPTGPANAKVTIVEYSDFECPYCQRAYPTVKQVMQTYPNDVKLVYKHLPLTSIHPQAQKSAEAAECAKEQGKFWEYHDKLFNVTTGV